MMLYPVYAFIVSFIVLILLLETRLSKIALDRPNHRSLHTKVTPRTGSLAIIIGIIVAWACIGQTRFWILPVFLLFGISLIDDFKGLAVYWRLLAQLVIGAIFVLTVFSNTPWWLLVFMLMAIVWMINLYNFMDGSDGLAAGMTVFGFGSYTIAAWLSNDINTAVMSASVATASFAFLLFNFHPARIFLGDGGSVPLGFLAAAIGIYGLKLNLWQVWFPLLVFSPFIVDASATLLKRLLKGEKIWQAHRNHYYQRLIQLGWGHRKTAIAEYMLMLASSLTAILLINEDGIVITLALSLWIFIYLFLAWQIDKKWRNRLNVLG